jgi:hypothetical protein
MAAKPAPRDLQGQPRQAGGLMNSQGKMADPGSAICCNHRQYDGKNCEMTKRFVELPAVVR